MLEADLSYLLLLLLFLADHPLLDVGPLNFCVQLILLRPLVREVRVLLLLLQPSNQQRFFLPLLFFLLLIFVLQLLLSLHVLSLQLLMG